MSLVEIGIAKFEMIVFDRVKVINFFVWILIGVNGLLNNGNIIGSYSAFAFVIIGIDAMYSSRSRFSKLIPAKKSKILLVDFIIYYSIILIISIIYNFISAENLSKCLFYASIIFSIGIILRYCNAVIAGCILMFITIVTMFFNNKIGIMKVGLSSVTMLIIVIMLIIISYLISLTLYKKRIFIKRI